MSLLNKIKSNALYFETKKELKKIMTKMDYTFDFLIQNLNLKYIHTYIYEKKNYCKMFYFIFELLNIRVDDMMLILIFMNFFLQAQFMYCIIFYSFEHGLNSCNILKKLRECSLEGILQLFQITRTPNT